MAGVPGAAVRELALDPHVSELLLDQIANADRELGDREDLPSRQHGGRPRASTDCRGIHAIALPAADRGLFHVVGPPTADWRLFHVVGIATADWRLLRAAGLPTAD